MAKITISINDDLLSRLDARAEEIYSSRSAFISQAVLGSLTSYELPEILSKIYVLFQKIADNNEIDEQSKKQIEEFRILVDVLTKK